MQQNGLDEHAVRALEVGSSRRIQDGEAVPVLITVQNSFTLGKSTFPARCDR
jgi:hypothetical protein